MRPTLQTLVRQLETTWKKFQAGTSQQDHLGAAIEDVVNALSWNTHIVLAGSLSDGLTAYGPFEDKYDAEAWANHRKDDYHVMPFEEPTS